MKILLVLAKLLCAEIKYVPSQSKHVLRVWNDCWSDGAWEHHSAGTALSSASSLCSAIKHCKEWEAWLNRFSQLSLNAYVGFSVGISQGLHIPLWSVLLTSSWGQFECSVSGGKQNGDLVLRPAECQFWLGGAVPLKVVMAHMMRVY